MDVNSLIDQLLNSEDSSLRLEAAMELSSSDLLDISNIESFIAGLNDNDDGVRDYISNVLSDIKPELKDITADKVAEFILKTNIVIRNTAADILTKLGLSGANAMRKYVYHDDCDVRKFAIDIIGLAGDDEALPIILEKLYDDDANVRVSVIEAAGNIISNYKESMDSSSILHEFEKAYNHDEELRPMIIEVAGKTNSKEGENFILEILERTDDEFIRSACIDALAVGGNSKDICDKLLQQLPNSNKQFQMIILRTIYGIAFRLELEIILPDELRYVAYNALQDYDNEIRSAGLLALGNSYRTEDVKYLIAKIIEDDFDTHQFIIYNLLSNSPIETVSEFFLEYGDKVISNNPISSELDFYGILASFWESAKIENREAAARMLYDFSINFTKGKSFEIINLMLRLERNVIIEKIEKSLKSCKEEEVYEALDVIDLLKLVEFKNTIKSMQWNHDRLDYKASSIIF